MSQPEYLLEQVEDLESRLAAYRAQLYDLATMGAVITSIQEIDAVLSVVMDMSIRLVNGEVGIIYLAERGSVTPKASWGLDDTFVRSIKQSGDRDIVTACYEDGEGQVLSDQKIKSATGIHADSLICMPIKASAAVLGVVVIINKVSGGNFSEEDREKLEILVNFVAVAIDNSNLMCERLTRQAIEREMTIARQVQETILPDDVEPIAGVEIGAVYYPAREVGGDFYDVVKTGDHRFYVVLGDVSNKGVPAALVMSASAAIIKSVLDAQPEIAVNELACKLNELLARDFIKAREMFVTLFFCRFDMENHLLTYCNAGHLPGMFWQESSRTIETLSEGGPIVGQFPGIRFRMGQREFHRGDRLFLFTDGLTEAEDKNGALFGRERAEEVFKAEISLPPRQFCVKVKEWVDQFASGAPNETHDDFTIMQVKVLI
jgi:sigma-B regulation protein RsbU (phosphoserine phosphatase)